MIATGIQVIKKLHVLLAVMLCAVLAFAMPVPVHAAPSQEATQQDLLDLSVEKQLVLFAGEISSGEPEAVLQLDKALLTPILRVVLQQLYPQAQNAAPAPHFHPASNGGCGLHTILTKGP